MNGQGAVSEGFETRWAGPPAHFVGGLLALLELGFDAGQGQTLLLLAPAQLIKLALQAGLRRVQARAELLKERFDVGQNRV